MEPSSDVELMKKLEGVYTAQVTPFTKDYELDEETLRNHVNYLIQCGMHGLVTTAGCGEFVNLSDDERKRVLEVTIEEAKGRLPVIMGVLSINKRHALSLIKFAKKSGADGALVPPPYYIKPSMEGVYTYFKELAEESGLPIILYNIPGRTGINLDPDLVRRLADVKGIVGLKECNRDLTHFCEVVRAGGDKFSVLAGDDDYLYGGLLHGAKGAIMAGSNLAPEASLKIYEEFCKGNIDEARKAHFRLLPLIKAWLIQNHPGPLKEGMAMVGRPVGPARKPLHQMTDKERATLREALKGLGML